MLTYGLNEHGFDPWQGQEIFLLREAFRSSMGPSQTPVEWVPVFFVKLTINGYWYSL